MRRTVTALVAAAALGAASLAAAEPADLMPAPIEGWTASGPVYGESLVDEANQEADGKRVEISRDYSRGGDGLRISLNTHDQRGVQLISYVNAAQKANPQEAEKLAAKGIVPFSFGPYSGVTMRSGDDGDVTGAALKIGQVGTLTLEGIADGKPDTVALEDVNAYLRQTDLERMSEFVRETNAAQTGEGN